jgi:hypothetical protein
MIARTARFTLRRRRPLLLGILPFVLAFVPSAYADRGASVGLTTIPAVPSAARVARGIAVAVHAPDQLVVGASYPFVLEAIGFATAERGEPLPGATVEVGWDPSGGASTAIPSLKGTSDADGRFAGSLILPPGEGPAKLLIRVSAAGHERVETISVRRLEAKSLAVIAPKTYVRPGSTVSARLQLRDEVATTAVAGAPIEVRFEESGIPLAKKVVTTDRGGSALVNFQVPPGALAGSHFTLYAETPGASGAVTYSVESDAPAVPSVAVAWEESELRPGATGKAIFSYLDAANHPVVGAPVWIVVSAKNTAPNDLEWKLIPPVKTGSDGRYAYTFVAPTLIPPNGANYSVFAKISVDGEDRVLSGTVAVGRVRASLEVLPETGELVPGALQDLLFRAEHDGKPLANLPLIIRGDFANGKPIDIVTNGDGLAKISVTPPSDTGAHRNNDFAGSCATNVGTTVEIAPGPAAKPEIASLLGTRTVCVPVAKARRVFVDVDRPVLRAGEELVVRLRGAENGVRYVVTATSTEHPTALNGVAAADGSYRISIPSGARGLFRVEAMRFSRPADEPAEAPRPTGEEGPDARAREEARLAGRVVLVAPDHAPTLTVEKVEGRLVPGGTVRVSVRLEADGKPVAGSVSALVSRADHLAKGADVRFDDKRNICPISDEKVGSEKSTCERFFEGTSPADALLRKSALTEFVAGRSPVLDPLATARADFREAFEHAVASLHKSVLEASSDRATLADVRRGNGAAASFHPELLASLFGVSGDAPSDDVPQTPGGEPISLRDLLGRDAQVNFSVVAKRVTRLKLLRALLKLRDARKALDRDEPVFKDPNVFLRRELREGALTEAELLDPWGGILAFKQKGGPEAFPFLTITHGWVLASPGPDGKLGTGDDIDDPFQRVVREGTPLARAVDEQRMVDARWDVEVSDATVAKWTEILEKMIDTGGLISGFGSGTGQGFGSGSGRVGGSHSAKEPRLRYGSDDGFQAPVDIGPDGRAVLELKLGAEEANYRGLLVATDLRGLHAATMVELPAALPTSIRAGLPANLVRGDTFALPIVARNRTDAPRTLSWSVEVGGRGPAVSVPAPGALTLSGPTSGTWTVPAHGEATVTANVAASRTGGGSVTVHLFENGKEIDSFQTDTSVDEPATTATMVTTFTASGATRLDLPAETRTGPVAVVVSRRLGEAGAGWLRSDTVPRALASLAPSHLTDRDAVSQALAVVNRLKTAGFTVAADTSAEERLFDTLAARYASLPGGSELATARQTRALAGWEAAPGKADARKKTDKKLSPAVVACPSAHGKLDVASAEFEPATGGEACWDAWVSETAKRLTEGDSVEDISRAILLFSERPQRRPTAAALAERLEKLVGLGKDGRFTMGGIAGPRDDAHRALRSLTYAALLAIVPERPATTQRATPETLRSKLLTEQAADGGFGSPEATRWALSALGAFSGTPVEVATDGDRRMVAPSVTIGDGDDVEKSVLFSNDLARFALSTVAAAVRVHAGDAPVLVRVSRTVTRSWLAPPRPLEGAVTTKWETSTKVADPENPGKELVKSDIGRLYVTFPGDGRNKTVHLTLPPGAVPAAALPGLVRFGSTLELTRNADGAPQVVTIPLRYTLAGTFRVPEGSVTYTDGRAPAEVVPSTVITVAP